MDLTSHELRTVELREAFRGYRQDDVDALLDRVADVLEERERDLRRLRERLARAEEAAAGAPGEQQLSRALMAAQRAADQLVAEAEDEAAATRRSAVDESRRARDEARAEAEALRSSARAEAEELGSTSRADAELRLAEATDRATTLVADAEAEAATTRADADAVAAAAVADAEQRAAGIVADARLEASRVAEERRRELAVEVDRLTARRRDLAADVDHLDRFVAEHRPRVRALLESELARFDGGARLGLPDLPPMATAADDPVGGPTGADAIVAADREAHDATTADVAAPPAAATEGPAPVALDDVAADDQEVDDTEVDEPVAEPTAEPAVEVVLDEPAQEPAPPAAPVLAEAEAAAWLAEGDGPDPAPVHDVAAAAAPADPPVAPLVAGGAALAGETVRLVPLGDRPAAEPVRPTAEAEPQAGAADPVGDREPGARPARPAPRRDGDPGLRLVGAHDEPVTAEVVLDDFDDLDLEPSPRGRHAPVALPFDDDAGPPTMAWDADDDLDDDDLDLDDDGFDDVQPAARRAEPAPPARPRPEPTADRSRAARIEIDLDAVRPRAAGPPPEVVVIDLDAVAARPTPVREPTAPRARRRAEDDPYLASLRAAVEDDTPLGQRGDDEPLYDDDVDDIPGRFGIFRRRR